MEKRRKRTLINLGVILVLITVTLAVLIRGQRVSDYTVDEHVERITERAKERYLKDKFSKYTDCKVYPLYDANDKFANYCVVEFQPMGYIFVELFDVNLLRHFLTGSVGMYGRCSDPGIEWRRYKIAFDGEEQITDGDHQWILDPMYYNTTNMNYKNRLYEADNDGQFIFHKDSPYKIENIGDEKRYLLKIGGKYTYVPAVKRGDKFLNLISIEEFEYNNTLDSESFPCIYLGVNFHGADL